MRFLNKLQAIARKASARVPVPEVVRGVLQRGQDRQTASPKATATAAQVATAQPQPATVVIEQPNWEMRTQAELVDHIVDHYHARLHRDLPDLVEMARRVEREHTRHPALPPQLADDLAAFAMELEGHMCKEETVLFPILRSGGRGGQLDMPIRMMERDHDHHGDSLERIRQATAGFAPPPDASQTWAELYRALASLEADLRQHVYLENHILFARASGDRDG